MDISDVRPSSGLQECPNHVNVTGQGGLVQRGRMRVKSNRVIAVRIFPRLQEHPDDVRVPVLS
jgi:hypothetical protein